MASLTWVAGRAAFGRLLGTKVDELRRGSAMYTSTGHIVKHDANGKLVEGEVVQVQNSDAATQRQSSCCTVS